MNTNSSLYSEDLAPISAEKRTWTTWNYAALWISMSLCIPTYMLSSSLIQGGMNWWQAILTIFLGNTVVLIPMILNGHAGAKYGIPFPVFARASFGTVWSQYSSDASSNCSLRLVRNSNLDWRFCTVSNGAFMDSIFRYITTNFPQFFRTTNRTSNLLFSILVIEYVCGVFRCRKHPKIIGFQSDFFTSCSIGILFWALSAAHGLGPILEHTIKIYK